MNRLLPPPVPESQLPAAVDWAIVSRRAIRAFLPTPVPRALLLEILDVARHSASGVNMQPWQVHVLTGAAQQRLSTAILRAHDDAATLAGLQEPYPYYPAHWVSPFLERRRQLGWQLYGLLGITRDDKARRHAQHARNYRFFDAPAGLIFTVHAALAQGSLIDYGMFLQSLMVAARARGLDTCPQVAFTPFHHIVAQQLGLPDTQRLVCGMSLGYADPSRPENALVSPREPVAGFTHFHDDEGSGPVPLP